MKQSRVVAVVLASATAMTVLGATPAAQRKSKIGSMKIPITTSSPDARQAYLQGRDLLEKLRVTDSRAYFTKAATLDPDFALAHYGLALNAPTVGDFFAALRKAVALADKASAGEADMILALEAQTNGKPAVAKEHLLALVRAYPEDERAHNLLGNYYFGRQEYETAVAEYKKATAINPRFSQPYNQLGYALRFLGRYDQAEQVFKKYVELIPDDPNPYDSYAELLMKRGRFADSIEQYRKALAQNADFVSSYVGIANDEIFLGKAQEARATLTKIEGIARNDGERRQAHFWTAVAYLHEGESAAALAEIQHNYEIAKQAGDGAAMAGDLNLMGAIELEAGHATEALAKYDESVAVMDAANTTAAVKEAAHRNNICNHARVALVRHDVKEAAAEADRYRSQVEAKKIPFEVRQAHEIAGLVADARGNHAKAVRELKQANQQDPRVLFELAEAYAASGDAAAAHDAFAHAADFNGLAFNYAFVRGKAKAKLTS
jgi:tetratricopeptide (TPR) repeat protein